MKRLILMRHAKTEPWIEGIDDHARALTGVGRAAAQSMTLALNDTGWRPDKVLVSTARRTRETWSFLSEAFSSADIRFEDDLYLAGERGISEMISDIDGASCILVVGHNPGLHDLAVTLIREAGSLDHQAALRISSKLSTGSAAFFEAPEDGPFLLHEFKLVRFIRPKDLVR